ncbi:hypothetical protein EDC04DRAFT_2608007 [Pisolithus marmoratus]|nr:hypothetical protein EDC04DRAFT_2608007 [Pisolithus marmoratus]
MQDYVMRAKLVSVNSVLNEGVDVVEEAAMEDDEDEEVTEDLERDVEDGMPYHASCTTPDQALREHRIIAEERDNFLHCLVPTPYGHVKYVWYISGKAARLEGRASDFKLMDDGEGFIVYKRSTQPFQLLFSEMEFLARDAISAVDKAIRASIPPECIPSYESFPWETLTDDILSSSSVFSQQQNHSLLPIQQHLMGSLGKIRAPILSKLELIPFTSPEGIFQTTNARSWLSTHHDGKILPSIIAALALTMGIPPRDFQWQSFLVDHDVTKGHHRSFFLLEGLPAIGNPKAKQRNRTFQECLWAIPKALAPTLLYFLGVFKPVCYDVMHLATIHDPIFDTHIFCLAIPLPSTSSSQHKDPTAFTERLLRIARGTMFGQLLMSKGNMKQAQVTDIYGHILSVPRTLNMSYKQALQYLHTSHVLQALYGLSPLGVYGIGGDDSEESLERNRRLVVELLNSSPYISGLPKDVKESGDDTAVGDKDFLGDEVLIAVPRATAYGVQPPPLHSRPPPGGYSTIIFSVATKKIVQALEEWRGSFCVTRKPSPSASPGVIS